MRRRIGEVGAILGGLWQFYTAGEVPARARESVLSLHCRTNGRSTDRLAKLLRAVRPPRRPAPASGVLGALSVAKQRAIARAIAREGYYVFERRLPAAWCEELRRFAAVTPGAIEGDNVAPQRCVFDPAAPRSKICRLAEKDIVVNAHVQRVMADPSFVAVAEAYLDTHPVLSQVNLWWSATFGNKPGADAAQEFHFDFDPPPIWLLFFIYLTDVGPENGPHVFVRGSHAAGHPAAAALRARGYVRIPDKDIAAAFGQENIVEIQGTRGTIIAVDTRGFHKGKMLTAGSRLMMQLTFSCPPFSGAHDRRQSLPVDVDPALVQAMAATPRVYQRYR
jgi:hypothetical protein